MTKTEESLRRHLRFGDAYALAVGSVIGTGIFALPGKAAERMGPAALYALLIGAALAGLLVLCYAEAASRFRGTGGAMRYAQVGLGDVAAFEVGWATWIARVVSWAALANLFVTFLMPLVSVPEALRPVLITLLIGTLTVVNLRGVQIGGRLNTVLTVLKVVPLLAFVGIGLFFLETDNFTPFAPHGYADLGGTTVMMLYAYVGFEGAVIPAAEVHEPRRNMPRALLLGMVTIFFLYMGVWTVCTGTLPQLAGLPNPVGDSAATFLGSVGGTLIQVGIVVSVVGINAFMALVTPRALYALSQERLLPAWFGELNDHQVPARAILLTSVVALILSATQSFTHLAIISVVARIAQYIPTCLAVLALRRNPDAPEAAFRVPFGPVIPVVAIVVCVWLLTETEGDKVLWGAVAVFSGLVFYLPRWLNRR